MARIDNTRIVILGLLQFRDMHGYEVKRTIEGEMGNFRSISYGSIYSCLRELEKEGCVAGHKEEVSKNPPRTVYAITDKGREEFQRLMKERLEGKVAAKGDEFLLPAFFDFVDEKEAKEYLLKMKTQYEKTLQELVAREKEVGGNIGKYLHGLIWRGIILCKGELDWLRKLEEKEEE
jgi:DNA-binding PadR family transcriptional regulator